tara:strand:+ start:114 stop:326 length:213 start_codon:yes stop_codon:yes gene_type:complete
MGGEIKTIMKYTIKKFKIRIPPFLEQKEISDKLKSVQSNIANKQKKLLQIQLIKRSLIEDLFSGRNRVHV